jgi:hypothetical protein
MVAIGLRINNNEPPKGAKGTSSWQHYNVIFAELQLCRTRLAVRSFQTR